MLGWILELIKRYNEKYLFEKFGLHNGKKEGTLKKENSNKELINTTSNKEDFKA